MPAGRPCADRGLDARRRWAGRGLCQGCGLRRRMGGAITAPTGGRGESMISLFPVPALASTRRGRRRKTGPRLPLAADLWQAFTAPAAVPAPKRKPKAKATAAPKIRAPLGETVQRLKTPAPASAPRPARRLVPRPGPCRAGGHARLQALCAGERAWRGGADAARRHAAWLHPDAGGFRARHPHERARRGVALPRRLSRPAARGASRALLELVPAAASRPRRRRARADRGHRARPAGDAAGRSEAGLCRRALGRGLRRPGARRALSRPVRGGRRAFRHAGRGGA